ncbi:MAG: BrnA antitoxin family protein [Dokdonella sp.]|nr:BrnA antitoxin family protein [Dokdonella sp.]
MSKVIERWRASGPGWQSRMVDVLEKSAPKSRRAVG